MKVESVVKTLDDISEVRQVLTSAIPNEGSYITDGIVKLILSLLHDYESYILQMDVIHK